MIHLTLQTEYSFKQCFGHVDEIVRLVAEQGCSAAGIADLNNTFGHVQWAKSCKKHGIKPIFGVRLWVVEDGSKQRRCNAPHIFIAHNYEGLQEIYRLVTLAWQNFYYIPRLYQTDLARLTEKPEALTLIRPYTTLAGTPRSLARRHDVKDFTGFLGVLPGTRLDRPKNTPRIAIEANKYTVIEDKSVYQLMAGRRKHGESYICQFEDSVLPQHILSYDETRYYFDDVEIKATHEIAEKCESNILPKAEKARWKGNDDLMGMCIKRLKELKLDKNKVYQDRLKYEIKMIHDKDFVDYFLIVADMIQFAKKTMFVGPARGSSAGSLVCYLLRITEIDPIEFGLLFERFIDINRMDLPDIDVDFPDKKREDVIKYLYRKYGHDKVRCLANINTFQPKSAIGEFASGLGIPKYETEEVKDAIIERSGGDARAAFCLADTFDTTDVGKKFIEKYPQMRLAGRIEGHASHAGKHAAGVIVAPDALSNYAGMNEQDDSIMLDKKDAEQLGLLKIDCLGLRTLTILEEVCDQIGMPYKALYSLELDDEKTFELFRDGRLNGVFQFEGRALQILTRQMNVTKFGDLVAITALARPGALNSGGANRYVKYHTPKSKDDVPHYYNDIHKSITEETFSVCVYQEQMMEIARKIGNMSWEDVSDLRKAASKSLGDEFFAKYKDTFMEGALKTLNEEDANDIWNDICHSGSWSFNKSHAVAYSLLSYWTAYFKANFPLEFAVAHLNNTSDDDAALKFLRDMVVNCGIEYIPVDPDDSDVGWSVHDGKLLGGLTNISGIGIKKAKEIKSGKITPSIYQKLMNPKTAFDILFPTEHYFGKFYKDPKSFGLNEAPVMINTIQDKGEYLLIGKLTDKNLRDLNEYIFVKDRGYEIEENNLYLLFTIEDDTDSIMCKIHQNDFEELGGREIAEHGKVGESWYIVKGYIKGNWRKIEVEAIQNLEEYIV